MNLKWERAFRANEGAGASARFWSAAVLCRFCFEHFPRSPHAPPTPANGKRQRTPALQNLAESSHLAESLFDLLKPDRNGLPRIFGGFVFECHVSLVIGLAKDPDEPVDVGWLCGFIASLDFHLQLNINGVGRTAREIGVGIVGLEVPGIEIDPDPGALHRADNREQIVRFRNNSPVVLQSQKNPLTTGIFGALFEPFDAELFRLGQLGVLRFRSCKDPDMWSSKQGGVVDPFLDHLDLLIALLALRQGKIVSHSRPADLDSAQKRMALELDEEVRSAGRREIIARQFSSLASLVGAKV